MKKGILLFVLIFLIKNVSGQSNKISINAQLDTELNELKIAQKITFFNKSNNELDTIFIHNWMNSFRDNETPLSKRLIEDYNKNLYFAKEKHRGFTEIHNISINYNPSNWIDVKNARDILAIPLQESLLPNTSVEIQLTYTVKIPLDKFTRYGRYRNEKYNLRYWYLVPALYDKDWKLMSHLNMDDMLMDFADYDINFTIPNNYDLSASLKNKLNRC